MSALELVGVGKVYGEGANEVHALRDIHLSVEPGVLVAFSAMAGSRSNPASVAEPIDPCDRFEIFVGPARGDRSRRTPTITATTETGGRHVAPHHVLRSVWVRGRIQRRASDARNKLR
jgi:hypothetical protein